MAARRISVDTLEALLRLHRQAMPAREVARRLALGPNTERRYRLALGAAGLLDGSPDELPDAASIEAAIEAQLPRRRGPQQRSSIEAWSGRVAGLLAEGLGPCAIHVRLRGEDAAFAGTLSAVKRLCRRVRPLASAATQ